MSYTKVWDVALQTNEGLFDNMPSSDEMSEPPFEGLFTLSDDLWIGKLRDETAKAIIRACEPCGKYVVRPVDQYGQLYAFVRELPLNTDNLNWDTEQRLQTCLAISRIVRPTTISPRYSERLFWDSGGDIPSEIYPVQAFAPFTHIRKGDQDYLTKSDLDDLRNLLKTLGDPSPRAFSKFPPRLRRAIYLHEYVASIRELEIRWPLVCTAFESLIHTDKDKSTKQFKDRTVLLAQNVGLSDYSLKDAGDFYDLRSRASHGDS